MGCRKLTYRGKAGRQVFRAFGQERALEVKAVFFRGVLEKKGHSDFFSLNTYTYGFNGKEKDQSSELGMNHYDYGFRIYNPAVARFLSVDPLSKEYPWYTPYQFAGNTPIMAVDLDGLEERVVIYDYTVDRDNPAIQVVDYRFTRDGVGPLGNGSMIIRKYKRKVRTGFISSKAGESFNITIDASKFVNPPSKLNDESIFKYNSKIKVGLFSEAGVKIGPYGLEFSGGSYAEVLESTLSERGGEGTKRFSGLKGELKIGPVSADVDPISGDYSMTTTVFQAIQKHTWNPETGWRNTSTATGEEDIILFKAGAGYLIGGEISFKLNNPLRKLNTTKWNKFLSKLQYDYKNNKRIEEHKENSTK